MIVCKCNWFWLRVQQHRLTRGYRESWLLANELLSLTECARHCSIQPLFLTQHSSQVLPSITSPLETRVIIYLELCQQFHSCIKLLLLDQSQLDKIKVLPSSICPEVVVVPGGGNFKSPHHLRQDRRSLFRQFPGKFF